VKNNKLQYASCSALLKKDPRNPSLGQNQQINASNVEKKDIGQRSAKRKCHTTLPGFKDNGAIAVDSKDCKIAITNCKLYGNITTPKAKDINNDHDPLTIQLLRLPEVNLKDHPKLVNNQPCDGSGIHLSERFLKQGSDAWKETRKGKVNGSRAACALGWRGRQEMIKYAQELKSGQETINDINDAMHWGLTCEDHAVATYINGMPCKKFEKNRTLAKN